MKNHEELNKWRDTLVSLIRKLNTAKISIPPKLIYRFNAIPIKTLVKFDVDLDKLFPKFIWKITKI